jgi:rsbT co-antagonist protein RsbR
VGLKPDLQGDAMTTHKVHVRPLAAADLERWRTLWQGYLDFYRSTLPAEITQLTWRRLLDPGHPFQGLAAVTAEDRIDGIVHFHMHGSTWAKVSYCYLEDLFVDPGCRGQGLGRTLIEAVYRAADEQGAERVYWHTEKTNEQAQYLYRQVAELTPFVQFRRELPYRVNFALVAEPTSGVPRIPAVDRVTADPTSKTDQSLKGLRTLRSSLVNRPASRLPAIVEQHQKEVLADWLSNQTTVGASRAGRIQESQLRDESQRFLALLTQAIQQSVEFDTRGPQWAEVREFLTELSRNRAAQGFTPSQVATFIFSLKQPLFKRVSESLKNEAAPLAATLWDATIVLDALGLYTTEVFQQAREQIIARQQEELIELSTPVVQLWDGVLALPLIGTLDSERTQVVMESLLERLVSTGSSIAVIDITGVPTVDTLVAQHLLKTVAAAQLMGADCIISGIRPQIAQTIVHLGIDLSSVATKSSLADAFALALKRRGLTVARVATPGG